MYKSAIIILALVWLFCVSIITYARVQDFQLPGYVTVISWTDSFLLLASILIYIRKHRA